MTSLTMKEEGEPAKLLPLLPSKLQYGRLALKAAALLTDICLMMDVIKVGGENDDCMKYNDNISIIDTW